MYFHYFVFSPHGYGHGPSFEQTWILFTLGCFAPSLVDNGSVVLENKILKFRQCIFAITLKFSLEKGWGSIFEQIWTFFTQGCSVPRLVEIDLVVRWKRIFENLSIYFRIFLNNPPPIERHLALRLNKLEFLSSEKSWRDFVLNAFKCFYLVH